MTLKTEPMLHKFSNLLRLPIFLAKLRKPFIPKLISLKKSRKLKRFKLLKHYDDRFKEEYEFSPSSTPLIYYQTRRFRSGSGPDMLSMLFLCRCFGGVKGRGEDADCALSWDWDALPPIPGELLEPKSDKEEEDEDSVDQRAEKFIQSFYEGIRMQKQESI